MKNKKVFTGILSAILAVLLAIIPIAATEHNVKKSERQNRIFAENLTELTKIANEIVNAKREGGMPKALSCVRENEQRAIKAVRELRGVCDYFEKLSVPKSLKSKLEKVRETLPAMRGFLDRYENMFHGVMLESEFVGYVGEMSAAAEAMAENGGFIVAEQEFMREMKRLHERTRNGLVWL